MELRKVLIVANKTALGPPLRELIAGELARGPVEFVLLVPATPGGGLTWEEAASWRAAEQRMAEVVAALREMGATVEGRVGDHSAFAAVMDVLAHEHFDEIIISTLPSGLSAWLGLDLPNRVRRASGRPVTHVVFDPRHPEPLETHPDWDRPTGRI